MLRFKSDKKFATMKPLTQKHNYYHNFISKNMNVIIIIILVVVAVIIVVLVLVVAAVVIEFCACLSSLSLRECLNHLPLSITAFLKQELQHLACRTCHQREWHLCWAKNKTYFNYTMSTVF
jgi:uncharacterized membrane protein